MDFKSKILARESVIGVIGLGYVGLPLVIRFLQEGFNAVGFDIDKKKINILNAGKSYIKHIDTDTLSFIKNNKFTATTDYRKIAKVDIIIICVPTPLSVHNEPNLSYINDTLNSIKPFIKKKSTLNSREHYLSRYY